MKALLALVVLFSSSFSFAQSDCAKPERDLLDRVQLDFNAGEGTRSDVAAANLNLFAAMLACNEMTLPEYCKVAPTEAQTQLTGYMEEKRVGQRSVSEIIVAQTQVRQIAQACKK